MDVGILTADDVESLDNHLRRVVATHTVDRYDDPISHRALSPAKAPVPGASSMSRRLGCLRQPSSVRRLHGHHNSRRTNKCGEVFSARRNFRIRYMRWLAKRHGPGAYFGATWRFSSWELPSFYSLKEPKNRYRPRTRLARFLAICPEGR